MLESPPPPPGATETGSPHRNVGRPFKPGQSGNPSGRPRIEPRVRKIARTYNRRMCAVLASIAEDPKAPVSERRRAAMDLIAVGSGRPATTQELVGKGGAPMGPLVALNFGGQQGPLSPHQAYRLMLDGVLDPDPQHFQRPAIEGQVDDRS